MIHDKNTKPLGDTGNHFVWDEDDQKWYRSHISIYGKKSDAYLEWFKTGCYKYDEALKTVVGYHQDRLAPWPTASV